MTGHQICYISLKGSLLLQCLRFTTSGCQRLTVFVYAVLNKRHIISNRLTSVLCSLVGRGIDVQQGVDYCFDYNLNILL